MSLIKIIEPPRRPRNWGRKLLWAFGGFVVLLLVLYFVGTSQVFLQRVILPQVSKAIKADVTVGTASISPFRQVSLRELKVHPRGSDPLMDVKEVRLRYNLLSIIRGKIEVEEIAVESPVITVVENADGTSNLDELLKLGSAEKKEPSPESSSTPPEVNVKLVALNNATVRVVKHHAGGTSDVTEVSGLNFSLRDLKNGQPGRMEVAANFAVDQAAHAAMAAGSVRAKLNGVFTFDLLADLKPGSVKGDVTFTVEQATGALAELAKLTARLDCEATPTEVKRVGLRFTKADVALGEVRLAGPLDPAKLEGKLKLEILALDRRVLNLAGAASGLDFGPTTINSTTDLTLANGGNEISVAGRLNVANFQVTRLGKTSPTLDLRWDYALTVDQAAASGVVKFFNLSGTQNSQVFLQSELPNPFPFTWGKAGGASGPAALNLVVTNWNLADWQAFAGDTAPAGLVNTRLNLNSQQAGQQLQLALVGGINKFSLKLGSNQVNQAELRWQVKAQATDLKQFKLDEGKFEILHQGQPVLVASATGTFDSATAATDLQVTAQAQLGQLLAFAPQPEVTASSGKVDFKAYLVGKASEQNVTGQFSLTEFTGTAGELRFNQFGAALDFDAGLTGKKLELRKAAGLIREGERVGGRFGASGEFDLATTPPTGELALKLVEFNQEGLRPFLQAALGDKKLVSIALNTTVSVSLGANGAAALQTDAQITNLVVSDPANPALATPLQARVQVDASMANQIAQIRQAQLTLTPTERAKNELNLTGTVDMTKSNAITGSLKLKAESLDVTRYYDLVAAQPAATPPGEVAPQPAPVPSSEPEQEPPAQALPFQNFTFDAEIDRFYLREVDIAKLRAAVRLDGGKVVIKPCALTLNGAPISATVDCDVGVPGYKYDVAFQADAIPFAPLVNSFAPDRKGQLGGTLTANAQIKGAGVTGSNLQKNLAGQFDVTTTNLNLSVANARSPILKTLVNVIIGIPELIRNPTAGLDSLIGRITGSATQKTSWTDELNGSPIDVILVRGQAGEGRVQLQQAEVRGGAFQALATGEIRLAPSLTNSTIEIPVKVALGRKLAGQAGLVTASTPTNRAYVELPDFLTLQGTLGAPKTHLDKLALVALAAKAGGGVAAQIGGASGEKAGALLNTVGGLFSKPDNTATNANGTNAPVEPAKKSGGLFDLFKKSKKE
jgi:uncharacterized protein involved in outer membrane biogenesis